MSRPVLRCTQCGQESSNLALGQCQRCGGVLLAEYAEEDRISWIKKIIWENNVSLGEGDTPYLEGKRIRQELGISGLWMKDESRNPTGSFKDRAIALGTAVAKEYGCKKIVASSSGNGAASVAAYSARAGIEAEVVVPEGTPVGKTAHAQTCGADIIQEPGSFHRSFKYAQKLAKEDGVMNLTTTFLFPLGVEGYKLIAYEMFWQAETLPDYCFIPVGAGPVLYGIYKGFSELLRQKQIPAMPRLVAVQSDGCAPIVRAWDQGEKTRAWDNPHGIASAIADPLLGYENHGDLTVDAIRESGGFALSVTDCEILEAGKLLAKREGIFVEPSSAAALAGLIKALQKKIVADTCHAALILTGSGLKDPVRYIG